MEERGFYLYCFTRSGAGRDVAMGGVDSRGAVTSLEFAEVAAVFSPVSLDEFAGELAESHLQDPEWVIPRVCQHERIVEKVMSSSPVLPVRFGTVFSSMRTLAEVLSEHEKEILGCLDGLSDKEEWSVKGLMDTERSAAWVLASDPLLREQWENRSGSPGVRYLQEKRLRAEAQRRAKARCRCAAEQAAEDLKGLALDVCPLRPQDRSTSGRDKEMVLNCALLLRRDSVRTFRQQVDRIGAAYAEQGITLEVSGPWPPYNFCPSIGKARE